jgi:hypothetical protein
MSDYFPAAMLEGMCVANQCRAMGLRVGDIIDGTAREGARWHRARLTLLWLGRTEAAWEMTECSDRKPAWSSPRESVDWDLSQRDWSRVADMPLFSVPATGDGA